MSRPVVSGFRFSSDGRRLVEDADGLLHVWIEMMQPPGERLRCVRVNIQDSSGTMIGSASMRSLPIGALVERAGEHWRQANGLS